MFHLFSLYSLFIASFCSFSLPFARFAFLPFFSSFSHSSTIPLPSFIKFSSASFPPLFSSHSFSFHHFNSFVHLPSLPPFPSLPHLFLRSFLFHNSPILSFCPREHNIFFHYSFPPFSHIFLSYFVSRSIHNSLFSVFFFSLIYLDFSIIFFPPSIDLLFPHSLLTYSFFLFQLPPFLFFNLSPTPPITRTHTHLHIDLPLANLP